MLMLDTLFLAQVSSLSDTQVYIALVVALIPGVLAWRLATELYK
ncbi:Photosystem I reaction center subunit XII [Calothrix sp. PCC 7507]|jgi:photosystem I subunit 12|nr:Photosystem I reaction center subunit XII [Calothrix sp. PCC 7507]